MRKVIINDKEYKIRGPAGKTRALIQKYGTQITLNEDGELDLGSSIDILLDMSIEMLWNFIVPRKLWFKPYLTYSRFKRLIDLEDVRRAQPSINAIITGQEDGDSGNQTATEVAPQTKKSPRKNGLL